MGGPFTGQALLIDDLATRYGIDVSELGAGSLYGPRSVDEGRVGRRRVT